MPEEIVFQELNRDEKRVLLQAYGKDIDSEGYILNQEGNRIKSEENPQKKLHVESDALVPGSLKAIDGSPSSISRYIRERERGNV